jgi:hypothetical protein
MRTSLGLAVLLSSALIAGVAQAADMPTKAPAIPYVQGPWLELYGGAALAPHSAYGYVGAVTALGGNLQSNGWLFRISGGDGGYSYLLAPGLRQNVDFQTGDISVGYQAFINKVRISGYLGANVQNDNNSDPLAVIRGTKWGIKGQGEIFAPINDSAYVYGLGTYSSAWNSYFVLGKLGFNVTNTVSIGPEVIALGNDRFDAVRSGAFVSFGVLPRTDLIISGGYSWDTRQVGINNDSGAYGSLHLRSLF